MKYASLRATPERVAITPSNRAPNGNQAVSLANPLNANEELAGAAKRGRASLGREATLP
jgi:hypothetical protein